jgi:hypothetical protein
MALRLLGSGSGYIELKAPASAGDNTLTLPVNNGSANQILKTDGNGNLSWVDDANTQLTFANDSDNRVITGTGSGLNAEATLTYDGTTLTTTQISIGTGANPFTSSANVFKGTAGQKGVYLRSALSAETTPSYSSVDDTDTGMFLPGSNVCAFTTGGTERLNISGTGHLTITCTSYSALDIISNNDDNNGPEVQLTHNSSTPAAGDCIGQIRFKSKDSATNTDLMSRIETIIDDPTTAQETSHLNFATRGYSSFNTILRLKNRGTASAPSYTTDDMNGLILDVYNTGNPYPRYINLIAKSAGDTDSHITFWTEATGGSPTKKVTIDKAGDTTIHDGDLIIGTADHGINFSAQTPSAATGATTGDETLNHYEEGTWTPTTGNWSVSESTANIGRYTRIGNFVQLSWNQGLTVVDGGYTGSGSGAYIGGLPFSVADCAVATFSNSTLWTSTLGSMDNIGSAIYFRPNAFSNNGIATDSMFNASGVVKITLHYRTT